MLDREKGTEEVKMLDESLKKIDEISGELEKQYNAEHDFFIKMNPDVKTIVDDLEKLRDNKNVELSIRLLASIAAMSEARTMVIYEAYQKTLNTLTRLSLTLQQSVASISIELVQLKQQASAPLTEANIKKISEIETQIAKLNKEFSKYSPTLKKFKQALAQTEKTLRENR